MDTTNKKIDWNKEVAIPRVENFCGYCHGEMGHSACDGGCFDPNGSQGKDAVQSRIKKAQNEVQRIPEEILNLKKRLSLFRQFLKDNGK